MIIEWEKQVEWFAIKIKLFVNAPFPTTNLKLNLVPPFPTTNLKLNLVLEINTGAHDLC